MTVHTPETEHGLHSKPEVTPLVDARVFLDTTDEFIEKALQVPKFMGSELERVEATIGSHQRLGAEDTVVSAVVNRFRQETDDGVVQAVSVLGDHVLEDMRIIKEGKAATVGTYGETLAGDLDRAVPHSTTKPIHDVIDFFKREDVQIDFEFTPRDDVTDPVVENIKSVANAIIGLSDGQEKGEFEIFKAFHESYTKYLDAMGSRPTEEEARILAGISVVALMGFFGEPIAKQAIQEGNVRAGIDNQEASFRSDGDPLIWAFKLASKRMHKKGDEVAGETLVGEITQKRAKKEARFGKKTAFANEMTTNIMTIADLPKVLAMNETDEPEKTAETFVRPKLALFTWTAIENALIKLEVLHEQVDRLIGPEEDTTLALELLGAEEKIANGATELAQLLAGSVAKNLVVDGRNSPIRDLRKRLLALRKKPIIKQLQLADTEPVEEVEVWRNPRVAYAAEWLVDLRDRYTLSNKMLRQSDQGLRFVNVFRNGYNSSTEENAIEPVDSPDFAKELVTLMVTLKTEFGTKGVAAFDELFENVIAEQLALEVVASGKRPVSLPSEVRSMTLASRVEWLMANLDKISAVERRILPEGVLELVEKLKDYKALIDKTAIVPELQLVEVEPVEIPEEPETPEAEDPVDHEDTVDAETESEADVDDVVDMGEILINQADKLDFEIFPAGAGVEDIMIDVMTSVSDEDIGRVDWERLKLIVELRDYLQANDGTRVDMFRGKPQNFGTKVPYYALRIQHDGKVVVVADNPQYGNATYVFEEDQELGSWKDILSLPKRVARDLGARALHHIGDLKAENDYQKHMRKIVDEILVQASTKTK